MLAKPHYMIAPGSSRNSQEESYGSNNMAYNYFIEEARKRKQERNRNSKPSVMHTTSLQNTTSGSKPKPRSNNQTSRSLPVSKSSYVTLNVVPLVDHSRNPSSFSDSKHFVGLTCQKCVFNAINDACLTKIPKRVIQSSSNVVSPIPIAAALRPIDPTGSPVSTLIDQDAPSASNPSTQEQDQSLIISQGVEESLKTDIFIMTNFTKLFMKNRILKDQHRICGHPTLYFNFLVDGLRIIQ
ncbi:hypothetical protein Tco_1229770 [Tanacetum coccineum]